MAKCTASKENAPPTLPKATYYLELNQDEAAALIAVFAYLGGDPKKSARGLVDQIDNALLGAGVPNYSDPLNPYYRWLRGRTIEFVNSFVDGRTDNV